MGLIDSPKVHCTVRSLGVVDYTVALNAMRAFTEARTDTTADEIWLCQHPAVFTQGIAGQADNLLEPGSIPVVQSNRGGQVTYHGPGQAIAYPLVDLKRLNIFVKEYVYRLEQALIKTLESVGVTGHRVVGAPGVYVRVDDPFGHSALQGPRRLPFEGLGKIAAIGVKVSRHCAYHGVALNVAMDLSPFGRINPCGYPGLRTIDLSTLGVNVAIEEVSDVLSRKLTNYLAP